MTTFNVKFYTERKGKVKHKRKLFVATVIWKIIIWKIYFKKRHQRNYTLDDLGNYRNFNMFVDI